MAYLPFQSGYDKEPQTVVHGFDDEAFSGYDAVARELGRTGGRVITVDCYPGVDEGELIAALEKRLYPDHVVRSEAIFVDAERLNELMAPFLTDDRVRGRMCYGTVMDFVDRAALEQIRRRVDGLGGRVLIVGFCASLIARGDMLVVADMARWEIQLRYRRGMPNFKQHNEDEDILRKIKRGFFVEWRIADRHKRELLPEMDYYLDANTAGCPRMVTGRALISGLRAVTRTPFRLVPYFDPGVWGGQWMKEVCNLDRESPNYAWCFDGVPEENSLYLRFGGVRVETPAMNLLLTAPRLLLGERTFSRFGAEFPIRFDFLDTMRGQNLSLQVHPDTEYIHSRFGMAYTQDESYYILDAEPGEGCVYLGVRNGIDREAFVSDLERAQAGGPAFDAERYVNRFPARKHDHFLIPAGTVHCSGSGCMVLEISATPYIFTFKLWDWERVGLDGRPRPIHIEDGKRVIRFERDTDWVKENLVNRFETLYDGEDYSEVRTGLHELEFIETRVYATRRGIPVRGDGEFAMLNLVEGKAAVIESADGSFAPYFVHNAETFVIPACAGDCWIRPQTPGDRIRVIKANVRF